MTRKRGRFNEVKDTSNIDDDVPIYSSSNTTIPSCIITQSNSEKASEKMLAKLPNKPEGKVSSKKRKRLEKYIEQSLKKEERGKLIKYLSNQPLSSDLLWSSKNIGQPPANQSGETKTKIWNNATSSSPPPPLAPSQDSTITKKFPEPILSIDSNKTIDKFQVHNAPVNNTCTCTTTAVSTPKAFYISLSRPPNLAVTRLALPVTGEEQPIMETITANDVTILCGATGSGKTTQVPQFLLEAGFGDSNNSLYPGMIGVTQPRRVAAVSVSKRVAEETGLTKGEVAYQIRYDAHTVRDGITKLKFMTDGILLRELSSAASASYAGTMNESERHKSTHVADLLLTKYSCIVVDEAHERTVATDILIGWLARIVKLRNSGSIKNMKPLKLVIMSATLRVEDFTNNIVLFPPPRIPPVINVEGRQYKVTIHYNRKTPELNYLAEAHKKICKIHTRLPPGGILVFLTGQGEIQCLVNKLRKTFPSTGKTRWRDAAMENSEKCVEVVDSLFEEAERGQAEKQVAIQDIDISDASDDECSEEESVDMLHGDIEEEDHELPWVRSEEQQAMPLYILPLYSLLPTHAQLRVFEEPPIGSRLCVIATNVAETSLTIPNIRYVIDTGKVKERLFDSKTGTQTYSIKWTSKASANQRAGRAGRVGIGHCYRLFSSAVFHDRFQEFSKPEILKTPIDGVVLQMKAMGIHQVVNFPFPTPPDRDSLRVAENLLTRLGAIDSTTLKITDLGRIMAKFPVSPRYAKMLAVALEQTPFLLAYTIAMVAGLSSGDPFIYANDESNGMEEEEDMDSKERKKMKKKHWCNIMHMFDGDNPTSDALRVLDAVGAYAAESIKATPKQLELFCNSYYIRSKAMSETAQLRRQLTAIIQSELPSHRNVKALTVDPSMVPPHARDIIALRQIIYSGYPDRVAKLVEDSLDIKKGFKPGRPIYAIMYGSGDEIAQIHPTSCMYNVRPAPKCIVYGEIVGRGERVTADGENLVLNKFEMKLVNNGDPKSILNAPLLDKKLLKGITVIAESWMSKDLQMPTSRVVGNV